MADSAPIRTGLRRALRRPGVLLGLWLLSLATSLVSLMPTGLALHAGLATRPVVLDLARGRADYLWAEILSSSGPLAGMIPVVVGTLLAATVLYWLTGVLLSGGLVAAMARPGHPLHAPPGRLLGHAADSARAMVRLELLGLLVLRLPLLVAAGLIGYLASHKLLFFESTTQVLALRFGPVVLFALLGWSAGTVTMHYARLFRLGQPHHLASAWRALRAGLSLATAARPHGAVAATAGLSLLSLCGYAALIVAGRLAAAPCDYLLWVGLAFVIRQAAAGGRSLLGLTVTAAAAEIWHVAGSPTKNVAG